MANRLHEDEIQIDITLVRKLVDSQFPQYTGLPLSRLGASGSTNVQFRLGDDLLARFPRQPGGGKGIEAEHRWTRAICDQVPFTVPEFLEVGQPAFGYGEAWAIVRWQDGEHPTAHHPGDPLTTGRATLAADFAEVLTAFSQLDIPPWALADPQLRKYRGRPLAEYDIHMRRNIAQCRSIDTLELDLDAALSVWEVSLELPGAFEAGVDRWYHGDLVCENLLLSDDGRLTGVLDFGGLGVGDPTVDLHGAWEFLDPPSRESLRRRLDLDDAQWLRGRAWALAIALMTFPYYWNSMPGRVESRLAMARSVLVDASQPV